MRLTACLLAAALANTAYAQSATVSGHDGQNNALGTVPCAAVPGQAVQSCPAELRHSDGGKATLAVQLSTGEVRRIYFEGGKATSSSSTSTMSIETRGDILVIFIEPGEVFEIPSAAVQPQ